MGAAVEVAAVHENSRTQMWRWILRLATVGLWLAAAKVATGQELPGPGVPLTLEQAVSLALENSASVLSAELQESQSLRESFADQLVSNAVLANRYVARNDARNYIVLGDPAVRLRTEAMSA